MLFSLFYKTEMKALLVLRYFLENLQKGMYNSCKGGGMMEYAISGSSLFWLFVPMPLLILLSIITMFTERVK